MRKAGSAFADPASMFVMQSARYSHSASSWSLDDPPASTPSVTDGSVSLPVSVVALRRRRAMGDASRSCSAAARRVAASGARRIFTAASLREAAGLRALAFGSLFAVSARGERVLRALELPRDLAGAERVAALFAVRVVRAVLLFAVVLRAVAVAAAGRLTLPVLAGFAARVVLGVRVARVAVAVFVVRAGALRAVVAAFARVAGARVVVVRVVAARPVALAGAARFFAAGAALARVVFLAPALVAVVLEAAAFVRVVAARVVLTRLVAGLAARVVFGLVAAFVGFALAFLAAAERADAAGVLRVVRAVAPRALLPAVLRPPARTAMARVRRPSVLPSMLMMQILCRMGAVEVRKRVATSAHRSRPCVPMGRAASSRLLWPTPGQDIDMIFWSPKAT